jgi:DNA-binding transcriptional ArsR family regulator
VELMPVPRRDELELVAVLQALSDPVRLEIVKALAAVDDGELACNEMPLPVTKSTASHHFRVLREAGVLEVRAEGTRRLHTLRRADLDARFPGLLDTVLHAAREKTRR